VFFASLDGAHFYRKTRPGDKLEFEQKLVKLREPLAIFEGAVTCQGERVARIERLVLAFGEELLPENAAPAGTSVSDASPARAVPAAASGSNSSPS
jgi:3-hydroxyacyl-[acyl-carrier-protein] dehydratase